MTTACGAPDERLARLVREIHEEARRARATPAPELTFGLWRRFADTGDRLAYERAYFERRRRLAALALAAHLDDRPDPALDDLLWSVCDEYAWVLPAHEPGDRPLDASVDLFAAETGHALAEIVTLLARHVDRRVRDRVREQVDRRLLRLLDADAAPMGWESSRHNWAAVCAGATGLAALALDSPRLPALLPRLRRAIATFLSGAGPDGACLEGPDYWAYGFGYFVYLAEALREQTGEDLLDDPHVRAMAAYPARIDLGDGVRAAFADSSARGAYPAGLICRLADRLGVPVPSAGDPSFHDDAGYRWGHLSRTLWWTREQASPARAEPCSYLPDAAIVVARGAGTAFAAKGGHNDEPHNHLDAGHFVLHAHGRTVLDDLGAPEYTRDYFREGRYDVPQASAEWHSVPLLDGAAQLPGRERRAEVLECVTAGGAVTFALDLTAAYAGPHRLTRTFHWRAGTLELVDAFDPAGPDVLVEELFVSRVRPVLRPGLVAWGPVELRVPAGWRAAAEKREVRGHDGAAETVHRVRLTARVPRGEHRFVFTTDPRGGVFRT
ncbi:hypothetical protein FAF44_49410 [Nonomuraea sp. MG754425]|uniref:heparinase II/III family protein n=1 Tax=Nonomuraea sp. MG754425 TaxID=2570319 RepID=UPI001F17C06E|nr:heparinase II/III family protein [Nonomuraea sp. MG754425]MCF6476308.1 hypothetical protein [Nonomuraea sp. MG754425]